MNLSVFWRLKDLISPAVQQVVRSARHAQEVMARANQSMQRGWRDSGETINSLRKKIQDLETARNAMRIGVDTRQIQAANVQIDRLNRQLNSLEGRGRRAEGRGGWLGGLMPKGVGVGLGLMGAVSMAQGALNKGMDMEVAEANFKHFVGNAQVAQDLIKQLQDYGDKYRIYRRADLINSGSALAETFGSGEVMQMTNIIGALAKGKSENFMGIMTRLQQVKGTGYLQGDELMELMNRGVFGLQEQIAKNKNITIAQFNKLKEGQKISWDDVKTALVQMTSEGGKYFGILDERMKQTKGKWDTISSMIENKITDFGKLTSGSINGILDFAIRFLNSTKPIEVALSGLGNAFRPIFSAIRDLLVHLGLINPAGDSVQQVVSLLTNVINIMTTAVHWAGGMLQWLVSVFQAIPFSKYIGQFLLLNLALKSIGVFKAVSAILTFTNVLKGSALATSIFKTNWLGLNTAFAATPIGLIITAVVALVAALYYAWNESEKFREVVIGTWGGIKEVWNSTVGVIWDATVVLWNNLKGAWSEGATALGISLRVAFGFMTLGLSEAFMFVYRNWELVKSALMMSLRVFVGFFTLGISELVIRNWENIKGFWDKFKDAAIDAVKLVMIALNPLLAAVTYFTGDKFFKGYDGAVSQYNQSKIDENAKDALRRANEHRLALVEAQKAKFNNPNIPTMPSGIGGGAGSGSGSGGGITDTVEGAKSKSITINLNKGLIETSNIIVDNKGTGLDIERQVVEALNRVLRGADRLALE